MLVVKRMEMEKKTDSNVKAGAGGTVPNPHGPNIVSFEMEGETSAKHTTKGTFVKPHILAIGCYPISITKEEPGKEKWAICSKIRRFLGIKPKHRVVGVLYNHDESSLMRLRIGHRMAPGNGFFMDDEELEGAVDEVDVARARPPQSTVLTPVVSGSGSGDPSFGDVAIYLPRVPTK
jgi:hypothetical protein